MTEEIERFVGQISGRLYLLFYLFCGIPHLATVEN